MINIFDTDRDVLAVKLAGQLTCLEIATLMNRLNDALPSSDRINILVDAADIEQVEEAALIASIAKTALELVHTLPLNRLALVVSRSASELKASFDRPPEAQCRWFPPWQLPEALAWVRWRSERANDPGLRS